jgi:hypothetical protein
MKKSFLSFMAILSIVLVACATGNPFTNFFAAREPAPVNPPASGGNTSNAAPERKGTPAVNSTVSGTASRRSQTKDYRRPESYETAYSYRTDTVDSKMRNIPKNIEANRVSNPDEYVRQIAVYINENSTNDFERVKKAHDLTALLVRYDAVNFWANTVPAQDYRNVLKTKLAVCEGYSNLFKKLCDELRIQCDIVHGFGRGVGTSPFAGDTPANSNHAWNIVTINNETYLIDCTWDSGYMDGRTAKQAYTTDWLFLKPDQFLSSHFPEDPKQQLMEKPLSADEFLKLPFYKPKFFEIVGEIGPELFAINNVDGKLELEYTVKAGFEISYSIYDESGGRQFPNNSFSQCEGDKYKAYFSFPGNAKYLLRIFWRKAGAKTGSGCGELGIVSSTGSPVKYPTQFVSSEKNIEIISPLEMPLRRGEIYEFKVRVENKNVVAIIHGKNFIQLTKGEDGIFFTEAEIPANVKELSIGIADSPRGRYEYVAQYQVF